MVLETVNGANAQQGMQIDLKRAKLDLKLTGRGSSQASPALLSSSLKSLDAP
jgi:hypothetical protein